MRTYRVLRYTDPDNLTVVGDVRANSAEAAERTAIEEYQGENGRYVAVPLRNWSENDAASKVVIELTPVAIAIPDDDEERPEPTEETEAGDDAEHDDDIFSELGQAVKK